MSLLSRAGPQLIVPKNYARPMVPSAIADAVAQWARNWGRSVRWQWVDLPGLHCWAIHLSTMPGDPKLKAVQDGRYSAEDAEEHILLTNGNEAIDIEQYGPSGLVQWLERGNMRSGRGEVGSLEEQLKRHREEQRERAKNARRARRAWASDLAHEVRRQVLKIPLHRVGIEIGGKDS